MKKEKLYFETDGEYCHPLSEYEQRIEDGEESIGLMLAKKSVGSGFMWCKREGEIVEQGDGQCGKFECKNYNPCNRKSGRCRHLIHPYEQTGKELVLTKDGFSNTN